ncbi:hypothetical protein M427DRAFT_53035, partial [Gonapodya prolifera JEL478]
MALENRTKAWKYLVWALWIKLCPKRSFPSQEAIQNGVFPRLRKILFQYTMYAGDTLIGGIGYNAEHGVETDDNEDTVSALTGLVQACPISV